LRRICCICGLFFGFKEPLSDDSETHGICDEDWKIIINNLKIKKAIEKGE